MRKKKILTKTKRKRKGKLQYEQGGSLLSYDYSAEFPPVPRYVRSGKREQYYAIEKPFSPPKMRSLPTPPKGWRASSFFEEQRSPIVKKTKQQKRPLDKPEKAQGSWKKQARSKKAGKEEKNSSGGKELFNSLAKRQTFEEIDVAMFLTKLGKSD